MRFLSTLVLTLLSSLIFAQNRHADSLYKTSKIAFGVNFSADRCFRNLENTNGHSYYTFAIDKKNQNERPKFGFTTGLNICYYMSRRFSLEGGIQYSNKGYQMKKYNQLQPGDMTFPFQLIRKYNFQYIDIPLKVNFILGDKWVRFFASTGVVTNFFIEENQVLHFTYQNGKTEESSSKISDDYNIVNFSPTISAGLDFKLGKKSSLRIEPTFRYGILSIIDGPIAVNPWSSGLNVSYYFRPDFLCKKK